MESRRAAAETTHLWIFAPSSSYARNDSRFARVNGRLQIRARELLHTSRLVPPRPPPFTRVTTPLPECDDLFLVCACTSCILSRRTPSHVPASERVCTYSYMHNYASRRSNVASYRRCQTTTKAHCRAVAESPLTGPGGGALSSL